MIRGDAVTSYDMSYVGALLATMQPRFYRFYDAVANSCETIVNIVRHDIGCSLPTKDCQVDQA